MAGAFAVIGTSVPCVDGLDKVRGDAFYVADLRRTGVLHGAVLRSPFANARIRDIDTSAAQTLPGVKAVVTHADGPCCRSKTHSAQVHRLFTTTRPTT